MKTRSRFYFFFFVFLVSFLPVSHAKNTERMRVTILIASNQGSDYDLVNDAYRDQLIKLFSYSSYHETGSFFRNLKKAEREKVDLPEGYELVLTLQGKEKDRVFVQALIRKQGTQYVDTVLSILKPGVVFLGGPQVAVGSLIIILEAGF